MRKYHRKNAQKQPAAVGRKTEKNPGPERQVRSKAAENAAQTEEESEEGGEEKERKERESRKKGRRAQWRGREGGGGGRDVAEGGREREREQGEERDRKIGKTYSAAVQVCRSGPHLQHGRISRRSGSRI